MIVLNGPPGCGKSTLARMYVDEHPGSVNLDIDRARDLIGRWRDDPQGCSPERSLYQLRGPTWRASTTL
jgi:hypothetical protein